jgi:hypothetical protein
MDAYPDLPEAGLGAGAALLLEDLRPARLRDDDGSHAVAKAEDPVVVELAGTQRPACSDDARAGEDA